MSKATITKIADWLKESETVDAYDLGMYQGDGRGRGALYTLVYWLARSPEDVAERGIKAAIALYVSRKAEGPIGKETGVSHAEFMIRREYASERAKVLTGKLRVITSTRKLA